jgi:uncharacterized RDD family membrane protein YckC
MKDKIIIIFILISGVVFAFILFYTTLLTQNNEVYDKTPLIIGVSIAVLIHCITWLRFYYKYKGK